jgi:hypothetical protein
VLAREVNARHNIGNPETARYERGPAVDHRVPDGARIVIPTILRKNQVTAQALPEFPDGVFWQSNFPVRAAFNLQA